MSSTVASVKSYVVSGSQWGEAYVYARFYDAAGNRIGGPVEVTGPQAYANVISTTSLSDGKFVIAYNYGENDREPSGFPTPLPYREHVAMSVFNADGTFFGVKDIAVNELFEHNSLKVKALTGGTYAYVLVNSKSAGLAESISTTLGFVDASGQAHETVINQDTRDFFSGTPRYHPSYPEVDLLPNGSFSVSYDVYYRTDFSPIGSPEPTPDPNELQRSVKVYDAKGHLQTQTLTDFDATVTVEKYDVRTGEKVSARTTFADDSRIDTQFGITGRSYVEQAIHRDADGHVTETKRYYGDDKHTLAFDLKVLADGTNEMHSYDTAGRETGRQIGDLQGAHDAWQFKYVGDSSTPSTAAFSHYRAGNVLEFVDATRADGSHVQTSYAAGATLTSHAGVADLFSAFAGGSDTFAFGSGFGKDTVQGFAAGSGAKHDVLQFDDSLVGSFADLQSHLSQVGRDTLISFDDGSSVTLKNVAMGSLTADNVHIVHSGELLV